MIYRGIKYASALILSLIPVFVFGMHDQPQDAENAQNVTLNIETDDMRSLLEGYQLETTLKLRKIIVDRANRVAFELCSYSYTFPVSCSLSFPIDRIWREIDGGGTGEVIINLALIANGDTHILFNTTVSLPLRQQMDVVVYPIASLNLNGPLEAVAENVRVMVVLPHAPSS